MTLCAMQRVRCFFLHPTTLRLLFASRPERPKPIYSVSQKNSPLRFSEIFSQTVGNF